MANMSYCRFENTLRDLRDCVDTLSEAVDEGKSMKEFLEGLSSDEQWAFKRMATYCQDFVYGFEALEDTVDEEA